MGVLESQVGVQFASEGEYGCGCWLAAGWEAGNREGRRICTTGEGGPPCERPGLCMVSVHGSSLLNLC